MSDQNTRTISRRAVAQGIAWTVPVVTVASTVPAFAASGWEVWFKPLNIGCKLPGASCESQTGVTKGYLIGVQVCHNIPFPTQITLRDASVSLGGAAPQLWQVEAGSGSLSCPGVTITDVPDPEGQQVDILLNMPPAPPGGEVCCNVAFGIEGQDNSSNGSVNGTAPYSWFVPGGPAGMNSGTGTLELKAPSTPPCTNCGL